MSMTLAAGTRLGPYTVVSPLGKGGMGEVYRATDTRLNRDVALKILPDAFAHDADRLARFQREAQVLASLNHPNIGAIHGLEESGGVKALVLELIDGPTLADRLASGPMPVAEAVATARQIADALDAAHEHGIVHRDLKPSNIKLRPDGTVKVLDFGLAKAADASRSDVDLTQSPTLVSPAVTQAGFILGTAAYMSPEQAKGRHIDKRSDIWAFGCVLYEMLTGTRAYEGDDVTDTMAAILRGEPDWSRVPADVPPALVRVLKRCLEKDRRQRRHDIADVRMDIEDALAAPVELAIAGDSGSRWMTVRGGIALAALVLVVAAVAGMIGWRARPVTTPPVRRFAIPLAPNEAYTGTGRHMLALSPDGSHLVYVANNRLNLRNLDQLTAIAIQGADAGAREPFFSPDGQWIAFWAEGQLKRVALTGGAPVPLAKIGNPFGASWSIDDTILFGDAEGIWRVPGSGGIPEQVIKITSGEVPHGPQLLPDGEHVLFTLRPAGVGTWDDANIVVQSLQTGERKTVIQRGRDARYVQTGHIVYATVGTLLAVRFDVARLATTGGAVSLVENVPNAGNGSGASHFAVAANGTMAYVGGGAAAQRGMLVWVDRSGREDPMPASAEIPGLEYPRLSPDGRNAALMSEGNLWVHDLHGRPPIKLTFDGGHFSPVWSSDGRRIFYEAATNLMSIAADGSGQPEPASPPGHYHAYAVSRDGAEVIVVRLPDANVSQTTDILRLAPSPKAAVQPVVVTANQEGFEGFSLSPDGKWLAYVSQATGQPEVWVQPYPGPGGAVRVSPKGGVEPVWAKGGRELFYLEGRRMMVVAVQPGATFSFTPAQLLFENSHVQSGQPPSYDVAADGRFLMLKGTTAQVAAPPIVLTLDWFEELKRRVP